MEYAKELQMDSQEAAVRMEEGRLSLPSDEEILKKQACFRAGTTAGSEGAEDAPTGTPFLCLKCWLNSAGWLIIFLYQNQADYLLSSCNLAKDGHIFASLSLSCVQAFSLPYIMELLA